MPIVIGALGTKPKRLIKGVEDYSITKIGQNTEKSPGDLRRLAVIQYSMKNHQLTLMRKTQ